MTNAPSLPLVLPEDHPGFSDPSYLSRRTTIAEAASRYRSGDAIPEVDYTPEEDDVWRSVSSQLAGKHREHACREYLRGADRLTLPTDRVPQLREVDERVRALTGFRIEPVPGLVPTRTFYGALAERRFLSTQYVRHHSVPLYTPEPDILHEVVGHGNCLAHDRFARLYRLAGDAARRVQTTEALEFISKVFWFSLEFGVVREGGEVRCYGAGLLSSYGEIQQVAQADLRPLNIARMGVQTYDITHYQPILFCAEGFGEVEDVVGTFFAEVDDELVLELGHEASTPA